MKYLIMILLFMTLTVRAEPSDSIYHVKATLTDQDGAVSDLSVHRGHPVLVTMFYSSCPMSCPLLIDTIRAVERAVTPASREQLRVLMITIDPEQDTSTRLKQLATERKLDTRRWTLVRTDASNVRKIAAALGIQYRRLPDGSFNHSSVVTLLDSSGTIVMQSTMLGSADAELVAALQTTPGKGRSTGEPASVIKH